MAHPREIRRLAFQALFQLDARAGAEREEIAAALEGAEGFSERERSEALELALAAFARAGECDAEMGSLAPAWPAGRQAAVDRAILRLAYHEMLSGAAPPKVVVNEAVELAKEFSTERSPAFVNALLDKVMRRVASRSAEG